MSMVLRSPDAGLAYSTACWWNAIIIGKLYSIAHKSYRKCIDSLQRCKFDSGGSPVKYCMNRQVCSVSFFNIKRGSEHRNKTSLYFPLSTRMPKGRIWKFLIEKLYFFNEHFEILSKEFNFLTEDYDFPSELFGIPIVYSNITLRSGRETRPEPS